MREVYVKHNDLCVHSAYEDDGGDGTILFETVHRCGEMRSALIFRDDLELLIWSGMGTKGIPYVRWFELVEIGKNLRKPILVSETQQDTMNHDRFLGTRLFGTKLEIELRGDKRQSHDTITIIATHNDAWAIAWQTLFGGDNAPCY